MGHELISVLGATGNVGRELVGQLIAEGHPVRVFARDERRTLQWGTKIERVAGDLTQPETLSRLLDGATGLFCLSFIDAPPALDQAILAQAVRSRVGQIVKLSTIGASDFGSGQVGIGKLHRERERWIEASGLPWTFLRPGFFMSNALRWKDGVKAHKVYAPAADGKTLPISPRDIAEVAKIALTTPGQTGRIYELTGNQALSAREQVAILAKVLDRPIEFQETPIDGMLENMRRAGQPEELLASLRVLWASVRDGRAAFETPTFQQVAGHPPQTFEAWCRENRAAFD
jgi:(4-alkanoyl-5-oxo-2,5-dihydrofuran-3-yl)methyl phosphate reductase